MAASKVDDRVPLASCADYNVGTLMHLAARASCLDELNAVHLSDLARILNDELTDEEFEHIRSELQRLRDLDGDGSAYLERQAYLAASILGLRKWDQSSRVTLAWIAIVDGMRNHGYIPRDELIGSAIHRTSSAALVLRRPHEMFATYSDATSLRVLLERAYVRDVALGG